MVSDIAERDAPPGIPPEEPQIVDGPSHIPHRYMGGDKRQRNQVPAQTVKPLFVTPDPVPTGAVSSGAQLPSSIKESRAIQPASSQAPSLTLQQALTNRQSGPLASNAHSGNMSLPQVPTLKHQSNFQPSPAVSSPVVLPGSGQVPRGPQPGIAPLSRATPSFPSRSAKHAPNGISKRTPRPSASAASHDVHSPFSDKKNVHKPAFGAGRLLKSKLAPKPLLSVPTPVPPRPAIYAMTRRPAAVPAQLASVAQSRPVNPPRTDAATPREQDACIPPVPHRDSKPTNLHPQAPVNGTGAPAKGQGPSQATVTVSVKDMHPGHKHTAPVYMPKAQNPDPKPVTQMLAQVYADQDDNAAPNPPQVKKQGTGGSSHPLEHQLSIDVLVPPDTSAAVAATNAAVPEVRPVRSAETELANAARAMLSLQGAPAAVRALDQRPQLRSVISAGAAAASLEHLAGAAAQAPAPTPAAAVQALLRQASLPLHATPGVNAVCPPENSVAPLSAALQVAGHIAQHHAGPGLHTDLKSQAQRALAHASQGGVVAQAPCVARQEHNPAAAIAEQARATAGKHVHPKLKLGSAPAGALASLVRQLSAGAIRPALCQPAAPSAPAHRLAPGPVINSRQEPLVPPQVFGSAVAGPSTVLYGGSDTQAAPCESAGSFVPQIPSPGRSTASNTVKVTLQHLLDAGILEAGDQVLKCGSEEDAQSATLNANGSVQLGHAAACSLTDLPKVMNDTGNALEPDDDVWHCVTYKGRPLQHYKRLYFSSLGAAPASPVKRKVQAPEMQTPFVWQLFDKVSEQNEANAEEDRAGDTVMAAHDEARQDADDAVEVVAPPPQKRPRRQATKNISYAQLASEGIPETKGSGKAADRSSDQVECTDTPDPLDSLCPVVDKDTPVEHVICKPLDVSFLQGIKRFAHLQPVSPRAESPRPIVPLTLPSKPPPGQPVLKRSPSVAKPAPQPAVQHNHSTCPAAAAAAAAAAAGVGVLQPLDKMSKLPTVPRKLKTVNAALPTAPKPAPSTTASCATQADSAQRSRRESRAPSRATGVSGLTHTMMQLEAYTRPAGDPGADAQPFSVDIHPVVLAMMDIHAHLCQNEIIGVLGGHYDAQQGRLVVLKSLSVREGVLDVGKTDVEMDPADQSRAIEELQQEGLQCVGWYHSHPTFPVWPSAIDVYNQNIQQVARSHQAANDGAIPYIAAIVGPYDQKNATSQCCMSWFYVENKRSADFSLDADPEVCLQHMVPKALTTNLIEKADLPVSDITQSAEELIERYAGYSARTELRLFWRGDMTCLQKLVSSVFHSVRGFLDADALKELGTSITSCALRHFYGVKPPTPTTTSKRVAARMGR